MLASLSSARLAPAAASATSCRRPAAAQQQPQQRRRRLAVRAADATPAAAATSEAQVRAEVTRRIKKLGRQNKPREAVAELASMAKTGVQPDTLAATALLDACARNGQMTMARGVFDELFCGLLPPDEVAFAVMLRGWGCSGKAPAWNEMSALLTTMEREYNITPSTITFNALLEACTRSNDAERAEEVMQRMLAAGIVPDDWTLEAVRGKRAFRSLLKRNFGVTFD